MRAWTMRDFTLVSHKMIRVNCNQFDKHLCFFHCVFVFKNKRKWSFLRCTQVLNIECAIGMSSFARKIYFIQAYRGSIKAKKSRRGCTFFTSHLSIQRRNDNVAWLAAFLQNCLDINEYFWNSPSKQMNLFDYLCHIFYWK